MAEKKPIWIVENRESPMTKSKDSEYIFESPCADFHSVNENERVYDKDDYLSHLDYLLEEIKDGSLMGECDHPLGEEFMPLVKQISHIILDLWYDKDADQVMVKIKLLDTSSGKDAKAIVDGGGQLYISSRASGFIDEETGQVELDHIYTYDIVYRPGFKQAKLKRINEKYNVKQKGVAIFERLGGTQKTNKNMTEYVTKSDFEKSVNSILSKLESVRVNENREVKKITTSNINPKRITEGLDNFQHSEREEEIVIAGSSEQVSALSCRVDELCIEKEALYDHIEELEEVINKIGMFSNHIVKFVNRIHKEFKQDIGMLVEDHQEDVGAIVEELEEMREFVDDVVLGVNSNINEFKEDIGMLVEDHQQDIGMLVEDHQQDIGALVEDHQEDIGAIVDELEEMREYSSHITEGINKRIKPITESRKSNNTISLTNKYSKGSIISKVNEAIELAKKNKVNESVVETKVLYPFIAKTDNETISRFTALDVTKKNKVARLVAESRILSKTSVNAAIDAVENDNDNESGFVSMLPVKAQKVYETLSPRQKDQILSLAIIRDIKNADDAEMFWEGLNINNVQPRLITESRSKISQMDQLDKDIDNYLGLNK